VTAKISDADVCWLRREAPSGRRLRRIARSFGVTERYLFNVIFGNARPDVPRSTPAEQLKLKFGRCPVGIRKLTLEEFNRPRRGDLLVNAERLDP
jgi:transcriptional regulator with XRE-family HTH domain